MLGPCQPVGGWGWMGLQSLFFLGGGAFGGKRTSSKESEGGEEMKFRAGLLKANNSL
jgi:hypothetical protein